MCRARFAAVFAAFAVVAVPPRQAVAIPSVPSLFKVDTAGTGFTTPTAIAFLPGGRMLVAEKRGRVYALLNGVKSASPLWSRENEVLNEHDRGLLGMAVDPNYLTNRRIYLLYTVDPDSNGTDTNDDAFGRIISIQVSATDSNVVDYTTRKVLMGVSWRYGPVSCSPSHTIGTLRFGSDGSLLASMGDGASYTITDAGGNDPNAFGSGPNKSDPYEDIGAFRSQSLTSLAGKILRIDPTNGHGYPSNPYWDSDPTSIRSRVWAYGVRNPFRFGIRPGTGSANPADGDPGTVFIGDVGMVTWEDMQVVRTPGMNFGWPCYEGMGTQPNGYYTASPAHNGCGSMGTSDNPASHTPPQATWHHTTASQSIPPGATGNAQVGGVFYTGPRYPASFQGKYFFADYGQNWLRVATFNASDQLVSIQSFGSAMDAPVDLITDPVSGDIFYVAINAGQVRRIRYTVPNTPPTATASASSLFGVVPHAVTFSNAGSSDPDGDPVGYAWDFGDGTSAAGGSPSHTYMDAGSYTAVLTADDTRGGVTRDTVVVVVLASAAFPTTTVLDDFDRGDGPVGGAWVGNLGIFQIAGYRLAPLDGPGSGVWDGAAFGPNQEAYVTFDSVMSTSPNHALMLKVQGTSAAGGHIQVSYEAPLARVSVATYHPASGWSAPAVIAPASFAAGDQFGTRALANGLVLVLKNGAPLGQVSVASWPFAGQGGRLGLTLADASESRLDDFGGGDLAFTVNTAPTATVLSPTNGAFFAEGDTIWLHGEGNDAETMAAALDFSWHVDLHHNTHIHPSSFVSSLRDDYLIGENHDDGTGVFYVANLQVMDSGGMRDTASVTVYPEVNLRPVGLTTHGSLLYAGIQHVVQFEIENSGRMPAPMSHWVLSTEEGVAAEGDTLVPPLARVVVTASFTPGNSGPHTLRVAVDSLAGVVEMNEADNATQQPIDVAPTALPVDDLPIAFALSAAHPNPTTGGSSVRLALPAPARVSFEVFDLQGRSVWRAPSHAYAAGRWRLAWPGVADGGRRVASGIYLAIVKVEDRMFVRRIARVR